MEKTVIFYDTHIEKDGNIIKDAAEKWNVKPADIYPLASLTGEKLKNADIFILVSPDWQSEKISDDWKNAVLLFKKSDLRSKKIVLIGYDENLNICPARLFREELKNSGVEFLDKCTDPSEKYAGIAIDKADDGKTTAAEVKEATKEMNYNPNAHL